MAQWVRWRSAGRGEVPAGGHPGGHGLGAGGGRMRDDGRRRRRRRAERRGPSRRRARPRRPTHGNVAPVDWTTCGDDLQCGSVTVPLNYADPSGRTIKIALRGGRPKDPAQRIGSLVINPGVQGRRGSTICRTSWMCSPRVARGFDISFDPRGVERSAPVSCQPPSVPGRRPPRPRRRRRHRSSCQPVPSGWRPRKRSRPRTAYGQACQKYSEGVLAYVGRWTRPGPGPDPGRPGRRQADLHRPLLRTLLGATYAQMYPDRSGPWS